MPVSSLVETLINGLVLVLPASNDRPWHGVDKFEFIHRNTMIIQP